MSVPGRVFAQQARGIMRSVKAMTGFAVQATDGRIGEIEEFYFDDVTWTMRYLVVNTGGWLTGRQVLLSPSAVMKAGWERKILSLNLTRKQIEGSPGIATDKPVSRQHQLELSSYFGWTPYWIDGMYPTVPPLTAVSEKVREQIASEERGDPHLRSSNEVIDYDIQAMDGKIGHVEDFLADDQRWIIRYLVVDTRDWLPGKKALVSVAWIKDIDWVTGRVTVDLSRQKIKNGPEYSAASDVTPEYEKKLFAYYNRPAYWMKT